MSGGSNGAASMVVPELRAFVLADGADAGRVVDVYEPRAVPRRVLEAERVYVLRWDGPNGERQWYGGDGTDLSDWQPRPLGARRWYERADADKTLAWLREKGLDAAAWLGGKTRVRSRSATVTGRR